MDVIMHSMMIAIMYCSHLVQSEGGEWWAHQVQAALDADGWNPAQAIHILHGHEFRSVFIISKPTSACS